MILVDGEPGGAVPATDSAVLRGDGVFEALRTFDGEPFALTEHLDRLEASAAPMALTVPPRSDLIGWIRKAGIAEGPGIVRIIVTRGDDGTRCRVVVLSHEVPSVPDPFTVLPVAAPWHPAGRRWRLAGVKTLSYAPNLDASRQARSAGFSDALLTDDEGIVLEGPTFSVAWLRDGVLETPSLGLGILDSITRRQVLAIAADSSVPIDEGRFDVSRFAGVTDLMAWSTVKQVTPITRCGSVALSSSGFDQRLRDGFLAMVRSRLGRQVE